MSVHEGGDVLPPAPLGRSWPIAEPSAERPPPKLPCAVSLPAFTHSGHEKLPWEIHEGIHGRILKTPTAPSLSTPPQRQLDFPEELVGFLLPTPTLM